MQVGWWSSRKRVDRLPPLEDVQLYGHTATKWYLSLQPEWRGKTLPLSRDVPSDEAWSALRVPGRNGLLSLIVVVGWWWSAAHEDREEAPFMYAVLKDLAWVVGVMSQTGEKGKKRSLEDVDEQPRAPKKRKT